MEIKDLCELFGISHSSVYYILAQQGFPQERAGYRKGKIPFATRVQILEEYKNGALVTDLSNKYNVTIQSIYHHLDRNGLRIKKEKILTNKLFTDPDKALETLKTPERPLVRPFLMALSHKPTQEDKLEHGTQVLDLSSRQLYVQMNHDKNNPLWVLIKPEKKGICSRIRGWFIK